MSAVLSVVNPPVLLVAPVPAMDFVNPLTDREWDASIAHHPNASVFHTSAWASVLSRTYGHELLYARFSQDNATTALVPIAEVRSILTGKRGVALPFSDTCEPLVFEQTESFFPSLCDLGHRRGWKHIEIRGCAGLPVNATPSTEFFTHELDLTPSPGKVAAAFAPSVRRAVRKAETSGLYFQVTESLEGLRSYYRLHVQTRRRHGLPPQPWSFFANLHRYLIREGQGFVALAQRGDRPVAGAVFLHFGKEAVYKFGASDHAFQDLRASNFVMAGTIRHLSELGFESLHFGRTSKSNQGLRRFKQGWGTREESLRYHHFNLRSGRWLATPDRATGWHNQFFRRMPLALNRVFGALMYPHLD